MASQPSNSNLAPSASGPEQSTQGSKKRELEEPFPNSFHTFKSQTGEDRQLKKLPMPKMAAPVQFAYFRGPLLIPNPNQAGSSRLQDSNSSTRSLPPVKGTVGEGTSLSGFRNSEMPPSSNEHPVSTNISAFMEGSSSLRVTRIFGDAGSCSSLPPHDSLTSENEPVHPNYKPREPLARRSPPPFIKDSSTDSASTIRSSVESDASWMTTQTRFSTDSETPSPKPYNASSWPSLPIAYDANAAQFSQSQHRIISGEPTALDHDGQSTPTATDVNRQFSRNQLLEINERFNGNSSRAVDNPLLRTPMSSNSYHTTGSSFTSSTTVPGNTDQPNTSLSQQTGNAPSLMLISSITHSDPQSTVPEEGPTTPTLSYFSRNKTNVAPIPMADYNLDEQQGQMQRNLQGIVTRSNAQGPSHFTRSSREAYAEQQPRYPLLLDITPHNSTQEDIYQTSKPHLPEHQVDPTDYPPSFATQMPAAHSYDPHSPPVSAAIEHRQASTAVSVTPPKAYAQVMGSRASAGKSGSRSPSTASSASERRPIFSISGNQPVQYSSREPCQQHANSSSPASRPYPVPPSTSRSQQILLPEVSSPTSGNLGTDLASRDPSPMDLSPSNVTQEPTASSSGPKQSNAVTAIDHIQAFLATSTQHRRDPYQQQEVNSSVPASRSRSVTPSTSRLPEGLSPRVSSSSRNSLVDRPSHCPVSMDHSPSNVTQEPAASPSGSQHPTAVDYLQSTMGSSISPAMVYAQKTASTEGLSSRSPSAASSVFGRRPTSRHSDQQSRELYQQQQANSSVPASGPRSIMPSTSRSRGALPPCPSPMDHSPANMTQEPAASSFNSQQPNTIAVVDYLQSTMGSFMSPAMVYAQKTGSQAIAGTSSSRSPSVASSLSDRRPTSRHSRQRSRDVYQQHQSSMGRSPSFVTEQPAESLSDSHQPNTLAAIGHFQSAIGSSINQSSGQCSREPHRQRASSSALASRSRSGSHIDGSPHYPSPMRLSQSNVTQYPGGSMHTQEISSRAGADGLNSQYPSEAPSTSGRNPSRGSSASRRNPSPGSTRSPSNIQPVGEHSQQQPHIGPHSGSAVRLFQTPATEYVQRMMRQADGDRTSSPSSSVTSSVSRRRRGGSSTMMSSRGQRNGPSHSVPPPISHSFTAQEPATGPFDIMQPVPRRANLEAIRYLQEGMSSSSTPAMAYAQETAAESGRHSREPNRQLSSSEHQPVDVDQPMLSPQPLNASPPMSRHQGSISSAQNQVVDSSNNEPGSQNVQSNSQDEVIRGTLGHQSHHRSSGSPSYPPSFDANNLMTNSMQPPTMQHIPLPNHQFSSQYQAFNSETIPPYLPDRSSYLPSGNQLASRRIHDYSWNNVNNNFDPQLSRQYSDLDMPGSYPLSYNNQAPQGYHPSSLSQGFPISHPARESLNPGFTSHINHVVPPLDPAQQHVEQGLLQHPIHQQLERDARASESHATGQWEQNSAEQTQSEHHHAHSRPDNHPPVTNDFHQSQGNFPTAELEYHEQEIHIDQVQQPDDLNAASSQNNHPPLPNDDQLQGYSTGAEEQGTYNYYGQGQETSAEPRRGYSPILSMVSQRLDEFGSAFEARTEHVVRKIHTMVKKNITPHKKTSTSRRRLKAAPDVRDKGPYRSRFLDILRQHCYYLLGIPGVNDLKTVSIPSAEEIDAFEKRLIGYTPITADNWRYDFSRKRDISFNRESIFVFAANFLRSIQDGMYQRPNPTPPEYFDRDYISEAFYGQLSYLSRMYRYQMNPDPNKKNTRLAGSARQRRKAKLHKDRVKAAKHDPTQRRHRQLLKTAGINCNSSDESDTEPSRSEPRKFRRVYPAWRSDQLKNLLYSLDDSANNLRQPRVGTRRVPGSGPRIRVPSDLYSEKAMAPPGLYINCYRATWLHTLQPGEMESLAPVMEMYDFVNGMYEDSSSEEDDEDDGDPEGDFSGDED